MGASWPHTKDGRYGPSCRRDEGTPYRETLHYPAGKPPPGNVKPLRSPHFESKVLEITSRPTGEVPLVWVSIVARLWVEAIWREYDDHVAADTNHFTN